DAPEKKLAFGHWSENQIKALLAGQSVTVSYTQTDRYGRIIGGVFTTNGTDASRFMVQSGAAWVYAAGTPIRLISGSTLFTMDIRPTSL
ncbi:thermonuclease family protein, partial [Escherichia coli]|nr:thermonuclease family protein [Escherichia coli]